MPKKQILVVFAGALEPGGAESSLLGLLDALDYNRVNVDLFLYGHHGTLFPMINRNVSLLPEINELAYLQESLKTKLQHKCYYAAWLRILAGIKGKFTTVDMDEFWAKIVHHRVPKINKHYDLALSFSCPYEVILDKTDASVRVGWTHTDYSAEKLNFEKFRRNYKQLDYVAAVSDDCKKILDDMYPESKDKIIVVENILSEKMINRRAEEFSVSEEMPRDGSTRFLTIGRFSPQKKLEEIPAICKGLRDSGLDVKWYIIGFGGSDDYIRQQITANGMEEFVFLLGKKENPYPYIKACDVYAQLSRYEGKSVAVREAQILGKPVVITNYATAKSQLEDGVDGVIVQMDIPGSVSGIAALLHDPAKMEQLAHNCSERDYTNACEVNKLYRLMEK